MLNFAIKFDFKDDGNSLHVILLLESKNLNLEFY